jgi:surfeit locus 1 family protein
VTRTARVSLIAVTIVAAGVCTSLGFWQGRRLSARRAANAEALAGRSQPVVDLNVQPMSEAGPQRRLRASGVFDHARTFILRGRSDRDTPGVHLVVPLLLDGRQDAILVNRGFVPAHDAVRPDYAWDRPERVTVEGIAFPVPVTADSGTPLTLDGATTWRRLDLATVRARLPYPVADLVLHQTVPDQRAGDASPFPRLATLPTLDDGPHLSYMIQWFGLAAASLAFGVIFGVRGGRREK